MANNITPESLLAIEYFYVLNSANPAPECHSVRSEDSVLWWVIASVSLGILLIVILVVGIYCIANNRRDHPNNTDK